MSAIDRILAEMGGLLPTDFAIWTHLVRRGGDATFTEWPVGVGRDDGFSSGGVGATDITRSRRGSISPAPPTAPGLSAPVENSIRSRLAPGVRGALAR
ncbi:MAG: hypothetical protein IH867_03490 [Chloroflexi bacterium]|nr:hypothetical protein [Chloroflexota bacterium]